MVNVPGESSITPCFEQDILVVKVGTSTLKTGPQTPHEKLDPDAFTAIGQQIREQREQGTAVVVVSSAAITAGMVATGVSVRPDKQTQMPELQRLASIGWRHVLNAWDEALPEITIGELLLTKREIADREEGGEALRLIYNLLRAGNVPVVNENDAITHEEIEFGDNDHLAAMLAVAIGSSALFGGSVKLLLLSDVNGLRADRRDPESVIRRVENAEDFISMAGDSESGDGTGGMRTKLLAASMATAVGIDMWIADGRESNVIARTLAGQTGTHFPSHAPQRLRVVG